MGVERSADRCRGHEQRQLKHFLFTKGLQVGLPIVKHGRHVVYLGAIQLRLEQELVLAVRFGGIELKTPEARTERRTGSGDKASHGLAELELEQKRRAGAI